MKKKIMAVVLCTSMLFPTVCVNAETSESDIKSAIEKAIEWKADKDSPFYGIGSYSSDFYIMALNRMGKNYDYSRYLAGLDGVAAGYGEEHNASSMQRTVLATIASGGDPRNVGGRDLVITEIMFHHLEKRVQTDIRGDLLLLIQRVLKLLNGHCQTETIYLQGYCHIKIRTAVLMTACTVPQLQLRRLHLIAKQAVRIR